MLKISTKFSGLIALFLLLDDLLSVWTRFEGKIQRYIPTSSQFETDSSFFNYYAVVFISVPITSLFISIVDCCGILFGLLKPLCKRDTKKRINFEKGSLRMWCNQSQLKLWMTSTWSARAILIEMHDQQASEKWSHSGINAANKWETGSKQAVTID